MSGADLNKKTTHLISARCSVLVRPAYQVYNYEVITNCLRCIHRPPVEESEDFQSSWAVCKKGLDVQYWTGPQLTLGGTRIKHLSIVRNGDECHLHDTGEYRGPRPTRFEKILHANIL